MLDRRSFLLASAAATIATGSHAAPQTFDALLAAISDETTPAAGRLAKLNSFDPTPLSADDRLDYSAIREGLDLEAQLARFPFGTVGTTIAPYAVTPRNGAYLARTPSPDAVAAETKRLSNDPPPPDFIRDATVARLTALPPASAIDRQIAALKALVCPHDAGVWRLPDGDAYYALALKASASLDIAPDAAHRAGLSQVEALSERADVLLKAQGLADGSVGARLHALGQDTRYLYSDDDAGRAKAVAGMNAALDRVRPLLGHDFADPPRGAIRIKLAGPGRIGYREAPAYDGTRPGAYYVDLRKIRRRPSWSLPTVVHHETLPGHLLQLALQEHADPRPLRLRYTPNAFFEGWAIYAEQLADEMGLNDDLARLGFLQSALVRAARLVIDTGIHFKRWSREDAIARFRDIAGDAPDTLGNEVDRMVVQPGFGAGAALGWHVIQGLRVLPPHDPVAFHTALLKRGALRLDLLHQVF
jgi:uncharacterized protein (DUF885 family)